MSQKNEINLSYLMIKYINIKFKLWEERIKIRTKRGTMLPLKRRLKPIIGIKIRSQSILLSLLIPSSRDSIR